MLRVENLSVAFGSITVLKNLSFTLSEGESLGIVGESGSGKSITALSLMGLLPSNATIISGKSLLQIQNGVPINLLGRKEADQQMVRGKHLSMIFQEPMTSLNPSMRCGQQVIEAILLHQKASPKDALKKCMQLFGEMQLPDPEKIYRSYPHQLSGGQKQRVMIAMALAGNPSILIADEPTTALDVTVQKDIILLLKQIKEQRGMSLLFISHDLGVISEISERLLVLKDGTLVEEGSTLELLTLPKHAYTKGLIACRPPLTERPVKLPTVSDFIDNPSSHGINPILIEPADWSKANQMIYSQEPILKVEEIDVEYTVKRNLFGKTIKSFNAVNTLSFNLFPGETLGLVGESGCGKTTLGRAILGLVNYKKGAITYKGKRVGAMNSKEVLEFRQDVQLVFQDPFSSLNPRHTVGEALMEPLKVHRIVSGTAKRKERAMNLLAQVALPPDSFFRYPHEFSGGQRQRIAIARALALSPKVLVCDEMVSALDVSVQAQILNLLNSLKTQLGLSYLFISHDLSVVKYMSNRMLIMQQGRLIEYGDSDTIYRTPQSDYTKKLIDSIPGV